MQAPYMHNLPKIVAKHKLQKQVKVVSQEQKEPESTSVHANTSTYTGTYKQTNACA